MCHFGACYFALTHKSNRKFKTQTGQTTEREGADKVFWRKRKEKVFNTRIWLIHNVKVILYCCWRVCLIRNRNILPSTRCYLLEDIVVGWSITSTFIQQTVKQLEVIWKLVLSDIYQLNGLGRWEQWRSSVELLASFLHREKMDFSVFVLVANPAISHRMVDHFMNEIIHSILQFCKFFTFLKILPGHLCWSIQTWKQQMSAGKHLNKVMVIKRNGYNN